MGKFLNEAYTLVETMSNANCISPKTEFSQRDGLAKNYPSVGSRTESFDQARETVKKSMPDRRNAQLSDRVYAKNTANKECFFCYRVRFFYCLKSRSSSDFKGPIRRKFINESKLINRGTFSTLFTPECE